MNLISFELIKTSVSLLAVPVIVINAESWNK